MGRIRRLSEGLINQIAAGEVVERPASVVKELAENAVDAGATVVKVELSRGGLSAITVIDDGHGMSREDALLSLERHATSKLADAEGLTHILTKGFRGEAVPAIASVSRFTLRTSEPGATEGVEVSVEGGGPPVVQPCAAPGGTRIDVVELFFNTPARRKFLKREATELSHCEEAVWRLALAHPEVGFFLEHDGKRLISSPATPGAPTERLVLALGSEAGAHLFAIEERRLGVHVHGFVASPEFTLPNARGMSTFVNRRYIRDRGLNAAIQRAFQDTLPPGRQPVAVVAIDVDPHTVDVNVHPQKLEVRFSDPRSVQEAVGAAISRALKAAPWRTAPSQPSSDEASAHYALAVDRFLARAQTAPAFLEPMSPYAGLPSERPAFGLARPDLNQAPPAGYFAALRFVGELGRRFWICEGKGGTLVVIDPRAVRERVLLDALATRLASGELAAAAPTLFSAQVALSPADHAAALDRAGLLAQLGVELEAFGADSLVVRRVPRELERADARLLLVDLVRALPGADAEPERALPTLARHAADGEARTVSHDEAQALLARLEGVDFGRPCEHGRVVVAETPLLELEARAD